MNYDQVAKVAHETNRAYCQTIDDKSQPAWEDAPQRQKASAIKGVQTHVIAHMNGTPLSPSASHDCWLEEKRLAGWKYGPAKDPEKKEHPDFVPFDELPADQRLKDYLFAAVVRAFFEAQG